jgi:hypothetical protein
MTVVGFVTLCWELAVVSWAHLASAQQLNCQKVGTVIPRMKSQLCADLALLYQPDKVQAGSKLKVCRDLATHASKPHRIPLNPHCCKQGTACWVDSSTLILDFCD